MANNVLSTDDFIKILHKEVAIILFEDRIIEFLSQVAIIEYDYDDNTNNYISVLTDVFDPYCFTLFHPSLSDIGEAVNYIEDKLNEIYGKHPGLDFSEFFENVHSSEGSREMIQELFKVLKSIPFHFPTTFKYVVDMQKRRGRIQPLHKEYIEQVEDKKPKRKNYVQWKLGAELETFLLHRDDGPVYSNFFFSIDEKLFAVLIFVGGRNKERLSILNNKIPQIFKKYKMHDELQNLLASWVDKKPSKEKAKTLSELDSVLNDKSTEPLYSNSLIQSYIYNIRQSIGRINAGMSKKEVGEILIELFENDKSPTPSVIEHWAESLSKYE